MALAATAASSHAATVQITLTGNKLSSTSAGGNTLNADLTGDGTADVIVKSTLNRASMVSVNLKGLGFAIAGKYGFTNRPNYFQRPRLGPNGIGGGSIYTPVPSALTALNPITFSDNRINGGAVTGAWLEVRAFNVSATSHTVQLTRLIFDDASATRPVFASIPGAQTAWVAVPEPSSFALLGLGAAGLLARRRRQAA